MSLALALLILCLAVAIVVVAIGGVLLFVRIKDGYRPWGTCIVAEEEPNIPVDTTGGNAVPYPWGTSGVVSVIREFTPGKLPKIVAPYSFGIGDEVSIYRFDGDALLCKRTIREIVHDKSRRRWPTDEIVFDEPLPPYVCQGDLVVFSEEGNT